jgi:hypothetical protein
MQFDEVLRTFAEFFEKEGIRYAVAGGLAVHAWGLSRTTRDIDFVVEGRERERVLAFARARGYETLHVSEGYSNHEHPDEHFGRIDLIYVYGETAEQLFSAAEKRLAAGTVEAPVPRPEHLIAMKVTAMKNAPRRVLIDVPDVRFLMSVPGIDREKVRNYCDRAGLLRIFDELERER